MWLCTRMDMYCGCMAVLQRKCSATLQYLSLHNWTCLSALHRVAALDVAEQHNDIYIYIYWINSANKYTSRVNFVKSKETGNKNKNKQKCFCLPSIKWYLTKLQFNYSSKLNLWKKLVDLHICIALPCYSLIITVVLLV